LEVVRISFFLSPNVQHFLRTVHESAGIYYYRWGDAPLRFILLAIFARSDQVTHFPSNVGYSHPCRRDRVVNRRSG
jgi:hypothetical protein